MTTVLSPDTVRNGDTLEARVVGHLRRHRHQQGAAVRPAALSQRQPGDRLPVLPALAGPDGAGRALGLDLAGSSQGDFVLTAVATNAAGTSRARATAQAVR